MGIFDPQNTTLDLDRSYSSRSLVPFIRQMRSNEERLQRLFGKEVHEDIEFRPIVQVRTLLGLIGLKQRLAVRNNGGKAGDATYRIDPDSFQMLNQIMERRAARLKEKRTSEEDD